MPIVFTETNCTATLTSNSQMPILNELSFCLKHHSLVLNQCHKMSLEIADWNLYPYAIDRHFDWQAAFYSQACSDMDLWFWFAVIWVYCTCRWLQFLCWVLLTLNVWKRLFIWFSLFVWFRNWLCCFIIYQAWFHNLWQSRSGICVEQATIKLLIETWRLICFFQKSQ